MDYGDQQSPFACHTPGCVLTIARTRAHAPSPPQVPLDAAICTRSDAGAPIVASDPASASARAYVSIAERLWETLRTLGAQGKADPAARGPSIVVE
jgi:hypothetical protein